MDLSFALLLFLFFLALAYLAIATGKFPLDGIISGGHLFVNLLPRLVLGFALAGLVQKMIPAHAMEKWLGPQAGLRGILVGSIIGMALPGGPYVIYPLVAGLRTSGAGIGSLLSLVTAKELFGPVRLIAWEYPLLGGDFLFIRFGVSLFLPLLVGVVGQFIYASLFNG